MRFLFFLLGIFGYQFLFAQKAGDSCVSVGGFFFGVYDKEEMSAYYANKYNEFVEKKLYPITIDFHHKEHLVITEIDGHVLSGGKQNETLWDSSYEISSDTVFIYPELSDTLLYRNCGFELPHLRKLVFIKNCAFQLSPLYAPQNNKLFKCFYFRGTAFIKSINDMEQKWAYLLLDSHAIGNLKTKSSVLVLYNIQTYTPYIFVGNLPIWTPLTGQ